MAPNMHLIPLEKYDPVHQYEKMSDKMKQRKDFDMNVVKLFYVSTALPTCQCLLLVRSHMV